MVDIKQQAVQTYHENISYFQAYQKDIFGKLLAFDNAVVNGHYQEKYELVFENGYFDVLEKSTGIKLYGRDSTKYADDVLRSVTYDVKEHLFVTGYSDKINEQELQTFQGLKPFENHLQAMAPLLHLMEQKIGEHHSLKNLEKYIFFGSGLGLHIEAIDKKIAAKVYLIVEDNLELFRLSLFVCNYKELAAHATLFLSIFEDELEFSKTASAFLQEQYYYNFYLKYFYSLNHSENKINQFHLAVTNQAHLHFFYNSYLVQSLLPLEYLFDEYQFLKSSVTFENTLLEKKPFILVGAGPSLQKNVTWLREHQGRFVVVGLSATLSLLEKESIKPDIIVHLDAFKAATKHFDKLKNIDFFQNAICLFSAKTDLSIVLRFKKNKIFFFENGTEYKKDSFKPSAPCVGSIAYQILLYLKVKNIYLLGLDLAVDSQTGQTHVSSHEYVKVLNTKENAFEKSDMSYKENVISIAGNKTKNVFTTPNFLTSIEAVNLATKLFKKTGIHVYNIGEGAAFNGTIPLDVQQFQEEGTFEAVSLMQNIFTKHSVNTLTKTELQELNAKKLFVKKIESILFTFEGEKELSIEKFQERIIKITYELCDDLKYDLSRVYDLFFRYFLPYIFDFFNDEKLQYTDKILEDVRGILTKELQYIASYYDQNIQSANIESKEKLHQFFRSLYDVKQKDVEGLFQKNSIGVFMYGENLEDKELSNYLKSLYRLLPEVKFKIFGFSSKDLENAKVIFEDQQERCEFKIINNVLSLEDEIEVCICNQNSPLDEVLHQKLREYFNIVSLYFNTVGKTYTVESVIEFHKQSKHPLQIDPKYFGFDQNQLEQKNYSVHRLLYESFIGEIADEKNVFELMYFDILELVITNEKFRDFYIKYLHNEISYIKEK